MLQQMSVPYTFFVSAGIKDWEKNVKKIPFWNWPLVNLPCPLQWGLKYLTYSVFGLSKPVWKMNDFVLNVIWNPNSPTVQRQSRNLAILNLIYCFCFQTVGTNAMHGSDHSKTEPFKIGLTKYFLEFKYWVVEPPLCSDSVLEHNILFNLSK